MIINAGLERVIIRTSPTAYTVVQVRDWVYDDDSLADHPGESDCCGKEE